MYEPQGGYDVPDSRPYGPQVSTIQRKGKAVSPILSRLLIGVISRARLSTASFYEGLVRPKPSSKSTALIRRASARILR